MNHVDQFLSSPSFVTWLLGQSIAVVLLLLWVVSLQRALKRSYVLLAGLQVRNGELSASLVEIVQSNSHELAETHESTLKAVLDIFEKGLQSRLAT